MSRPSPHALVFEPWFESALLAAALGRGARVLQLEAQSAAQSAAILARIGETGALTVVEPVAERAAAVDALTHPHLGVLACRARGSESLGMHDVVICCPPALDPARVAELVALAVRNLRPGGRLVFDLPAQGQCDVLREAWQQAGGDAADFAPFAGVDPGFVADELVARGVRRSEATSTTHVVRFASPLEAALRCVELCEASAELTENLRLVLTQRFGTIGELELPFHRLRATAMR